MRAKLFFVLLVISVSFFCVYLLTFCIVWFFSFFFLCLFDNLAIEWLVNLNKLTFYISTQLILYFYFIKVYLQANINIFKVLELMPVESTGCMSDQMRPFVKVKYCLYDMCVQFIYYCFCYIFLDYYNIIVIIVELLN